jgi:hypothetical protein
MTKTIQSLTIASNGVARFEKQSKKFKRGATDMRLILSPFDIRESMEVAAATKYAGVVGATIRTWCVRYGIGRKIAGDWHVSRVALRMFMDGNTQALAAYHAGDRDNPAVVEYFVRVGLAGLCGRSAQKEIIQQISQTETSNGGRTVAHIDPR